MAERRENPRVDLLTAAVAPEVQQSLQAPGLGLGVVSLDLLLDMEWQTRERHRRRLLRKKGGQRELAVLDHGDVVIEDIADRSGEHLARVEVGAALTVLG